MRAALLDDTKPCSVMQMNRTILNYQKAYRKKVEGLKQELKTTRAEKEQLHSQIQRLKGLANVHLPSLATGALLSVLATKLIKMLRKRRPTSGQPHSTSPAPAAAADGEKGVSQQHTQDEELSKDA